MLSELYEEGEVGISTGPTTFPGASFSLFVTTNYMLNLYSMSRVRKRREKTKCLKMEALLLGSSRVLFIKYTCTVLFVYYTNLLSDIENWQLHVDIPTSPSSNISK